MSDGHRTSSIQRPRPTSTKVPRADADGTRFSDFTRPISRDKQLVSGSGYRLLIGVVAVVVVAALMGALFVLPVKSWYRQRDDLAERQRRLVVLQEANTALLREVAYLKTPDGIMEAAREEIGYGNVGEKRVTVLPSPQAPLTLPARWPYDGVTQILAVRVAEAAKAAAPPPAATTATSVATPTTAAIASEPTATTVTAVTNAPVDPAAGAANGATTTAAPGAAGPP
ncbi:MAG: hypothetical protein ABIR68_08000 [Ilumatobacteraceae bacterium]